VIRLAFIVATEFQKQQPQPGVDKLLVPLKLRLDHHPGRHAQLCHLLGGHAVHCMLRGHMADLMPYHSGQLCLVLDVGHQPPGNINKTSRQCESVNHRVIDYSKLLDPDGLRGARLGVARNLAGFHPDTDRLFDEAVAEMKRRGAEIVDPADVPNVKELGDPEFEVMLFEFKAGLEAYFASLGPKARVKTLADAIAFNDRNREREMPFFGQEIFLKAVEKGPLSTPAYREALETCARLSRKEGLDAVLDRHRLDALVAPTGAPAWVIDPVSGDHFVGGNSTPAAARARNSSSTPAWCCGFPSSSPRSPTSPASSACTSADSCRPSSTLACSRASAFSARSCSPAPSSRPDS